MRKIKLALLITILIIPFRVHALEASLEISCNTTGLYTGEDTTCTILGHSDGEVTGLEFTINYDGDDVEIGSFTLSNEWDSLFSVGTITPQTQIGAVADASGENQITGDFTVGTFTVSLKTTAESSEQEISLSAISFYDENVTKTTLTNPVTIQFADFFSADDFEVDSSKMVIYRIPLLTVGTFKSAIITNAILNVYDFSNELLDDFANLATGQLFRVSFKGHNTDYKVSVIGDANGDGAIDDDDARRIALHIIGSDTFTEDEYLMAADYDNNTEIKMNDVMRLLIDTNAPIEEEPEEPEEPGEPEEPEEPQ